MRIPLTEQPPPGVDLHFMGGVSPSGVRVGPDAVEVGQGDDSRFFTCPRTDATGAVCVDGVWCWEFPQPAGVH
jgi:hypothetical protein